MGENRPSVSGVYHGSVYRSVYRAETGRAGFTLLELVAALAIFVVFIGLLWSILATFAKSRQRGIRLGERSQLVRSLAQLLSDDLAAAIQDPIHPHQEATGGDDSIRRFGLSGTTTTLRIDLVEINPFAPTVVRERQARAAAMGELSPTEARVPELKTVYYDFLPLGGSERKGVGLVRREIDFETAEIPGLEDGETALMPEVVGCVFRYFDGRNWRNDWDSIANNGLPVAIETTLRLMPLDEVGRLQQNAKPDVEENTDIDALATSQGFAAPISQRIVVHLPTSPIRKYREYERAKPAPRPETVTSNRVRQPAVVQQASVQPSIGQTATPQPPPVEEASPKAPTQQWIRKQ